MEMTLEVNNKVDTTQGKLLLFTNDSSALENETEHKNGKGWCALFKMKVQSFTKTPKLTGIF